MDVIASVAKLASARRSGAAAWGIVAALFAVCLAVRFAAGGLMAATPFIVFVPALPVATLLCGWRPAVALLIAAILSGAALSSGHAPAVAMTPSIALRIPAVVTLSAFLIAVTEVLTQTVQRLQAAARINADLFRELQHRVANNFQLVAATLHRTRRGLSDPEAVASLERAILRIEALGRLHRRLYEPDSYADGLTPVLRDVLEEIFAGCEVEIALDVRCGELDVGKMTDIVLLVSEAAVNAMKHVFEPGLGRRFSVTLKEIEGKPTLRVADDGPGFKPGAIAGGRLGLEIMRGLAARLGGRLELQSGPGATLRVDLAE